MIYLSAARLRLMNELIFLRSQSYLVPYAFTVQPVSGICRHWYLWPLVAFMYGLVRYDGWKWIGVCCNFRKIYSVVLYGVLFQTWVNLSLFVSFLLLREVAWYTSQVWIHHVESHVPYWVLSRGKVFNQWIPDILSKTGFIIFVFENA